MMGKMGMLVYLMLFLIGELPPLFTFLLFFLCNILFIIFLLRTLLILTYIFMFCLQGILQLEVHGLKMCKKSEINRFLCEKPFL